MTTSRSQRIIAALVAVVILCALSSCGSKDKEVNPPSVPEAQVSAPGCFDAPNLAGDVFALGPTQPRLAEARCATLWTNGGIARRKTAPELIVCLGGEDTPLVFPSENPHLCSQLGLAPAD